MHNIPIGILGASGYAGRELCTLVAGHPRLALAFAAAESRRGETVRVRPAGAPSADVTFVATDDAPLGAAALVFSALPHGASGTWAARAHGAGAKVVDLSADLRPGRVTDLLLDAVSAARWPATARSAARSGRAFGAARSALVAERAEVPYGLPELFRDAVRGADVVANPGCYATAVLVALAPLARARLLAPGATIAVSAASGVTGAGNAPRPELLYGAVAENFRAYGDTGGVANVHRHLPEMRATLAALGADVDLVFTPHLLPVARGILATMTVPVAELPERPLDLWRDAYADEPFVEVADAMPALADVVRRNVVRVTAMPVSGVRVPTLLVVAAVDNLMKGAAGQAVQNANLMLGLDETAGLPT